ncbi:MAG TPA: type VI secretion system baseplate subunit TssE [Vicinamibacterales bacterium]|jgi:type VI secretion system protein ImpF|nr:type VI secretion system baseplate subunit TssE [Vicinamibacterales bacterium]
MPDQRTPEEQLQPALLDRLTDDQPEKRLEPRMERVISKRRMREAVLRDLTWLFNTTRLDPDMDPALSYARKSVINFGLPALSGQTASSLDISDLERSIRQAILDYEPRILPGSLHVRAIEAGKFENHNVIGVEISGQLWSQPLPLELLVRTEIDLETGQVEVADLAQSSRVT